MTRFTPIAVLLVTAPWLLTACDRTESPDDPGSIASKVFDPQAELELQPQVRDYLASLEEEPAIPPEHVAEMKRWRQRQEIPASLEEILQGFRSDAGVGTFGVQVEGAFVGGAAQPGSFYLKSLVVSEQASVEDLKHLADDELLILRLMAVLCLARTAPREAMPVLLSRLTSQEEFVCFPGGCCGEYMTEGEFAWNLLHNRRYLDGVYPDQPLLPSGNLLDTDLRLLASEAHTHLHATIVRYWDCRAQWLPPELKERWAQRHTD
ncbi:MAG: hypothetical protein NTW86_32645 [Candidatus Sumerlaeota bacterium]|nr:hypothetical protein [Candidatus Sumerlaeota bacterium]